MAVIRMAVSGCIGVEGCGDEVLEVNHSLKFTCAIRFKGLGAESPDFEPRLAQVYFFP